MDDRLRPGHWFQPVRKQLARITPLRSLWHLLVELATRATGTWRAEFLQTDELFADTTDPWSYDREIHRDRLRRAEILIDRAAKELGINPQNGRVLELGCAEGHLTLRLAEKCADLTAIDISPTALARARVQVHDRLPVTFLVRDVTRDPLPTGFDLIVVDGILDYFRSRKMLADIARRLYPSLQPGGMVLFGNTCQHPVIENAWWARLLVRGGVNVNRFVCKAMVLTVIAEDTDTFYSYLLAQAGDAK